jgi:hypothetical protein
VHIIHRLSAFYEYKMNKECTTKYATKIVTSNTQKAHLPTAQTFFIDPTLYITHRQQVSELITSIFSSLFLDYLEDGSS